MQTIVKSERKSLDQLLAEHTAEGKLYQRLRRNKVRCYACGHRCVIPDHRKGICKVRFNEGGTLHVPRGYIGVMQCDPIEKKPFFHSMPGSDALSFGMLGCDFHCAYCQNWITSQALRDPASVVPVREMKASRLVEIAGLEHASTIASTYNEPLITSEWAVEVFEEAKQKGFLTAFISNGNGTPQVLSYLRPSVDLYKVDLKGFNDPSYRQLGGVLANVLDTIQNLKSLGFWVEVVTLVVPGFNDSEGEIRELTTFLASVDPLMPWHVTAFHRDYRMTDREDTSAMKLVNAAQIGAESGLKYIYAGNLPGRVGRWENTYCHSCGELLIERDGYLIRRNSMENGTCPKCSTRIPGVWKSSRTDQSPAFDADRDLPVRKVRFCG